MNHPLDPIRPFLEDPQVTEVLIDGCQHVYFEKQGVLQDTPSPFTSDDEVYALINAIAEPLGRVVNESAPLLDLRLPDSSLVNVVIPPIALNGPVVTIRKMWRGAISIEDLIRWDSVSQEMVDFLRACVQYRINVVVSGGTASGKTTMLLVLARFIPETERIVVLQREIFELHKPRVVNLETRSANIEGRGEIRMRDLVRNAARMRPDRIVVSEVSGEEVFDLLALMNSGHDGTLFSLHANGIQDALARLEVFAGMGNPSVALLGLREQIASAIQVIVHQERLPDGSRKILRISEVSGLEDGIITTRDLFEYHRTGIQDGRVQGYYTATGVVPAFLPRLQTFGDESTQLPVSVFTPKKG